MKNIVNLIKLDLLTVMPDVGNIYNIVYLCLALFIAITNGNVFAIPLAFFTIIMSIAVRYTSVVFSVGEVHGVNTLYATLSVSRREIVIARYVYIFVINAAVYLISVFLFAVIWLIKGVDIKVSTIAVMACVMFLQYYAIQIIQATVYLVKSYTKAYKLSYLSHIIYLPFFGILYYLGNIGDMSLLTDNPGLFFLASFALCLALTLASYAISYRAYAKRDI